MEIEVKISKLSERDIINILGGAFSGYWYEHGHTLKEIALELLKDNTIILSNYEIRGTYMLSLNNLCKGIGLFIKNGGGINLYKYSVDDCNKIIQYSLFGTIMF